MSEPTSSPLSDDEARRQRQEALRALSHSQSDSPARTARRRQPRWLVVLSGVLALVLVAGVVLHQPGIFPGRAATSHKGPGPVRIRVVLALSFQGPDCVQDAAWSPNGQQVAMVGYRDQCPSDDPSSYNYQAGMLQIYTAATGKLVHTILLDSTVLALPGMPAPHKEVEFLLENCRR